MSFASWAKLAFLILTFSAQASFQTVKIDKLFAFSNLDEGKLKAAQLYFTWEGKAIKESLFETDVLTTDNGFGFEYKGAVVEISLINQFLGKVQEFNVDELQATAENQELFLKSKKISTYRTKDNNRTLIHQLKTQCNGQHDDDQEELLKYIETCALAKGEITIEKLELLSDKKSSAPKAYRSIQLELKKKNYDLKAKTRYKGIGVTVKSKGLIDLDKEKSLLIIRIDSVSASFFDLKDRIFKELKKRENRRMKVERPYVTIDLTETSEENFLW